MFEVALSFAIHTIFFVGVFAYAVHGIVDLIRTRE
jgi:hypothetical protein